MKSEDEAAWPVAIAGGGFSGTMLAAQLARRGVRTLLCDGSGRLGRGVAYATPDSAHILNVPAAKMSAWPDAPGHFADWLGRRNGGDGTTFALRREFGRYLGEQLAGVKQVTSAECNIVSAERYNTGWRLLLSDGRQTSAKQLVLAQGNQPPTTFGQGKGLPKHAFINDPWSDAAREATARLGRDGGAVLILGTGLTMIDTMLSLAAAGHRDVVVALSRRGLVPRAHGPNIPRTVDRAAVPSGNVLTLMRWLRAQAADGDWRAAVDQLRPHTRALWQSWDEAQQRRFLRHARPWWDVHRHRIAPQIGGQIEGLLDIGKLEVLTGRLRRLEVVGEDLAAVITLRSGEAERQMEFATVFNCTGSLEAISQSHDSLIQALLKSGEVGADELELGLAVDEQSKAGQNLWALGPLTKGSFWEMVAVPDIRNQCASVAEIIAEELELA